LTALQPRPRPRSLDADASVLVDAALDGDELAWRQLCDRFAGQVRGVAAARVRDSHAVQDIVQDTFLRAWTRLHQLDDADRVGAWLKTIAANVAIDHLRSHRPTASLDHHVERVISLSPMEDHVIEREAAAVLHGHLAGLREIDRQALWQRDALGASVSELSDDLGLTPGSVRVLLTRARGKVRDGYGALVIGFVAFADATGRLRARLAGLGESVPTALIAPALVVAAVTGVVITPDAPAPDAAVSSSIAPAVTVRESRATQALSRTPIERAGPADAGRTMNDRIAPATARSGAAVAPKPTPASAPVVVRDNSKTTTGQGDGVTTGDETRDDEPNVQTGPQLPVAGIDSLDVYLEDRSGPRE
jgi:RNA polymerase sigma factor (sigma-70 family)